ncbi:MAG: ShlB/FhaC/HecB family hemolysin secretion/activation protein [Phycisphaerales bacterium]|nr:ShlB/FhaC/HecB family hemolysin secretion/activation protein [Phycisphaerales bacterium]
MSPRYRRTLTWALALASLAGLPVDARAGLGPSLIAESGSHSIDSVVVRYAVEASELPDGAALLEARVELVETAEGFAAPEEGQTGVPLRLADIAARGGVKLTDTGLAAVAPAVLRLLKSMGYVGVYVTPDPLQFGVVDGVVVDTREAGDGSLRLEVTLGTVTEVRTLGVGERVKEGESLNNPLHRRIIERSPVGPHVEGETARRDLLRADVLDAYTARLNRHPGRRVDVAVSAPGDTPGAVTLDYMVTENRPWLFFGQVSNTGSGSTDAFREHMGFIHNDLSNNDDIFTVGYQTANFDDVHQVYAFYDRPFPNSERLRWKVHASYYEYVASELGLPDLDFSGQGWDAGVELKWNFFQHKDLFVDLIAGARFENVRVQNDLAGSDADEDFLIPHAAMRLERFRDQSRTEAQLGVDLNLAGIAGTSADLDALGRLNADDEYAVLRAEAVHSFYLDPLFDEASAKSGNLAHEVLMAFRGQHSLGSRLIPNEEMAAGGLYTVRGYPTSKVAGDDVVMGTLEYRFHVPRSVDPDVQPGTFMGQPFRWKPQYAYGPTDWDLVFKGFVDAARVLNSDRESFEVDETLVGAGVGAEFSLTRRFNVRVDLGVALAELDDGSGGHSVDAGHTELHIVLTLIY